MTAETGKQVVRQPVAEAFSTIDREHLARQTMGDEALMCEVLRLFAAQIRDIQAALRSHNARSRQRLGHTLKGAARGVGAFELASLAEELETAPDDDAVVERLSHAIDAVSLEVGR